MTHAVVKAEVMVGLSDSRELGKFDRLFRRFELLHVTEADSEAAIAWLRRLHLSHKVGFPDCLIAATAIRVGVPVVTLNLRHFRLFKALEGDSTVLRAGAEDAPRCGGGWKGDFGDGFVRARGCRGVACQFGVRGSDGHGRLNPPCWPWQNGNVENESAALRGPPGSAWSGAYPPTLA